MDTTQWQAFLSRWSQEILASPLAKKLHYLITPQMRETGWLGAPGATEAQIQAAEQRLGTPFPPSYRSFLQASNGWSVLTDFTGLLYATETVVWLRDLDPLLVQMWGSQDDDVSDADYFNYGPDQDATTMRGIYMHTGLVVSDPGYMDGEFLMLNPQVVTDSGEWEAWFFASWKPGAKRYRSFWELMHGECISFQALQKL